MTKELKFKLFLLSLLFSANLWAQGPGSESYRIEKEIKLNVPSTLEKQVWSFLKNKYGTNFALENQFGAGFETSISEELFLDTYFDNSSLDFLKEGHGIRHRKRYFPNKINHEDHGKELLQIKLSSRGMDAEARDEIKFKIRKAEYKKSYLDQHPFIGIIAKEDREDVISFLYSKKFDPMKIHPVIDLKQERKRIYIKKDGRSFATITLDLISSTSNNKTVSFSEIELELNEIGYTFANSGKRQEMDDTNNWLKDEIQKQFPSIVQDQSPKYNKLISHFEKLDSQFKQKLSKQIGSELGPIQHTAYAIGILVFIALLLFLVLKTKTQRENSQIS